MINISKKFRDRKCSLSKEVYDSNYLTSSGAITRSNEALEEEQLENILKQSEFSLPISVKKFYQQVTELSLNWEIVNERHRNGIEREAIFKRDIWIKQNLLDKDYSWEAVRILLSGSLNIPEFKNLIDIEFIKATGMYAAATKVGLTAGSLLPLDTNEFAIACMKHEDGELIDNIYLYTGFGEFPVKLHDMGITFEKYLDLAYKAKCFNYWNLVYCLRDKAPNYELMKRFFPVIFPHIEPDLEEFGITY
ncbi:hypothetical protein [Dokdonia sp.]|uniref:hypothetical protein n=1 Tax=Dokdonia sp. TaxID=2024995 RepID=UPI0032652838